MGKPAATARPCLRSLSHSFTLDFIVLCNGTKAQAHEMKEELTKVLNNMGLKLSEEKTQVTHITEGFPFLGYRIIRSMGTNGKMVPKIEVPEKTIKRFRHEIRRIFSHSSISDSVSAKFSAANRVIQGWCQYYQATSNPGRTLGRLRPEIFLGAANWLGRKYEAQRPEILQRFRQGNTLGTKRDNSPGAHRVQSQKAPGKNPTQPLHRLRTNHTRTPV